jgi:hypothetical protein
VVFSAVKLPADSVCDVFKVQIFLPHGFEVGLDASVVVPDPYGTLNVIVPLGVVPGAALKIITVSFNMLLTVCVVNPVPEIVMPVSIPTVLESFNLVSAEPTLNDTVPDWVELKLLLIVMA